MSLSHICLYVCLCVQNSAELIDGVAELPDKQTLQQTDVNETHLTESWVWLALSPLPRSHLCEKWTRKSMVNREEIKRKKGKSFVPEPLMVSISTRATLAPFAALQMVQAASVASVRTRHQVGLEFESGHRITVGFIFIIIARLICTLVSDLKGTA